jgi:hypothetical protein
VSLRSAPRFILFAVLTTGWATACVTHPVTLVVAEAPLEENCVTLCEALFGAKPTLHCGRRATPSVALLCAYERPPAGVTVRAPADDACRAECAQAGIAGVEACGRATSSRGTPAVACQYPVGAH